MRSTSAATALAVLFSSVALSVAAAGSASAEPAVLTQPVGLVADGALQRVFVADQDNGRILATDYNGTLVDLNVGFGRPSDLALSDDGRTLYASLPTTHEIVALDATDLQVRTRYDLGAGTDPREVAFAGGRRSDRPGLRPSCVRLQAGRRHPGAALRDGDVVRYR
ncbi:YncE family protein [Streptomyces sp. NPDC004008]